MAITWKYKTDVSDISVFEEIKQKYGISVPDELKEFILKTNAATPSRYNFMVGNNERVLGAVLSFNHGEVDTDSVFTALDVMDNKKLMPFGVDPFGNYICYLLESKMIVFWDHETGRYEATGITLTTFEESLY